MHRSLYSKGWIGITSLKVIINKMVEKKSSSEVTSERSTVDIPPQEASHATVYKQADEVKAGKCPSFSQSFFNDVDSDNEEGLLMF